MAISSVESAASSISLVSVDSTKQHGAHVFDVSCRICTGADDNTSSASTQNSNSLTGHESKDSDSSQQAGRNDHSPRKKICLAQRLKMYSTERQKSSSSSTVQTGNKFSSAVDNNTDVNVSAVCDEQQDSVVRRLRQSSQEQTLNTLKLTTDTGEWQIQTVEKPQKETSAEDENGSNEQKLHVLHEEPLTDTAKHLSDQDACKLPSLQEVGAKKEIAAEYVSV